MSTASEHLQEQEKVLTPEENLEAILFQFVKLYERWSEDRQVAAKQGSDIDRLVKTFTEQVGYFESLEEDVREDIKTTIETEAKNTALCLGKTVGDAATKETELTILKLKEAVHDADVTLTRYAAHYSLTYWGMIFTAFFGAVVTSLLIFKLLMPQPTMPLTEAQISTYHMGTILDSAWPKLSARQQRWIIDIANEKVKNHEKLMEDAKTTHPDPNESLVMG